MSGIADANILVQKPVSNLNQSKVTSWQEYVKQLEEEKESENQNNLHSPQNLDFTFAKNSAIKNLSANEI